MTNIKITVAGTTVTADVSGDLTSGMVGATYEAEYDSVWDNLAKLVVFRVGGNQIVALDGKVPHVLLTKENVLLQVGVEGRNRDGDIVLPTIWTNVGYVVPGAHGEEGPNIEPNNPAWKQSASIAQEALDKANNLQQRADRGEFQGPPGPQGPGYEHSKEFYQLANQIHNDTQVASNAAKLSGKNASSAASSADAAADSAQEVRNDANRASAAADAAGISASTAENAISRTEIAANLAQTASTTAETAEAETKRAAGEASKLADIANKCAGRACAAAERAEGAAVLLADLNAEKVPAVVPAELPDKILPNVQGVLNALAQKNGMPLISATPAVGDLLRVKSLTADGKIELVEPVSPDDLQKEWEKVEQITMTEDAMLVRTAWPDGTPYHFVKLFIGFTLPEDKKNKTVIVKGYGDIPNVAICTLELKFTQTNVKAYGKMEIDGGWWNSFSTEPVPSGFANSDGYYSMAPFTRKSNYYPAITKIETTLNQLPAGTTVEIWAVKSYN